MIEDLKTDVQLDKENDAPPVKAHAAHGVFLNLTLIPRFGTLRLPEGKETEGQLNTVTCNVYLQLAQGNPPNWGFKPNLTIAKFVWKPVTLATPPIWITDTPDPATLSFSRSMSAWQLIFELEEADRAIDLQIELQAEWGREQDVGPIGQNVGTF